MYMQQICVHTQTSTNTGAYHGLPPANTHHQWGGCGLKGLFGSSVQSLPFLAGPPNRAPAPAMVASQAWLGLISPAFRDRLSSSVQATCAPATGPYCKLVQRTGTKGTLLDMLLGHVGTCWDEACTSSLFRFFEGSLAMPSPSKTRALDMII